MKRGDRRHNAHERTTDTERDEERRENTICILYVIQARGETGLVYIGEKGNRSREDRSAYWCAEIRKHMSDRLHLHTDDRLAMESSSIYSNPYVSIETPARFARILISLTLYWQK